MGSEIRKLPPLAMILNFIEYIPSAAVSRVNDRQSSEESETPSHAGCVIPVINENT